MTDPEKKTDEPVSWWHRRIPGIRYVYLVAAIVGGVVLAIRFAGDEDRLMFFLGLGLFGLGVLSVPLYWWMDRRGL